MSIVDSVLYNWIVAANERRETLELPLGLIEDSIALLRDVLGIDFLQRILISDSDPISLLDPDVNPLKMWLKSALVDQHIDQVLEIAAYLRLLKDDPALPDKVDKLKRDRFWPVVFELAMASRLKRVCEGSQSVALNRELPEIIGDFSLDVAGMSSPCECTRLGHSPQVNEPFILAEALSNRISDATKSISVPLIFKIRSTDALTGTTYNLVLRLLRRCLADVKRLRLPTAYYEGATSVCCGELTRHSERIPFKMINGTVTNVDGTDWDMAYSLDRVPAAGEDELIDRYKAGERFGQFEAVRTFLKFGPSKSGPDYYGRLTNKLRKKLKQTKVRVGEYGKLIFIQVPFDLRAVDQGRLEHSITEAVGQSRTTIGIILAHREANPHYRHHYSLSVFLNKIAFTINSELASVFERFRTIDTRTDPITGLAYRLSWEEARARTQAGRERKY